MEHTVQAVLFSFSLSHRFCGLEVSVPTAGDTGIDLSFTRQSQTSDLTLFTTARPSLSLSPPPPPHLSLYHPVLPPFFLSSLLHFNHPPSHSLLNKENKCKRVNICTLTDAWRYRISAKNCDWVRQQLSLI